MKDVFKYIKSSRELLEGKAAEEAKKKGYVGDKSGYWIDRKGERVARTIGGELKCLHQERKLSSVFRGGGSKGEKSRSEFKSEKPRTPIASVRMIQSATQIASRSHKECAHHTDDRKQHHVQKN